ncbi:hypothetical protein [sulfur-oxidizing endosymbiont of Gigantopelta aegis]|uniref:hypothetical protein n=1 Tax=sulfur-oxidizing endosymbiont of Gigantopelta aegis TaxID=2794934 RepID=UPI0018DEB88B|nr:hypothetical protein [sulfur-oxidizing endosymbiont of Gigantopelta aegis]
MAKLPEKTKQIAQVHAQLINSVVMACQNQSLLSQLEPVLQASEQNGWQDLIARIRKILSGSRDTNLLVGLDEEDAAIALAILVGLQDQTQLPKMDAPADKKFAAPGLANIIDAATKGDVKALSVLGDMAEQMVASSGDIRYLGAMIRPLINGERDLKVLTKNMDEKGVQLVENLLDELSQLNPQ